MFNSQNVITEHVSDADLRAYFVGFDFGKYRYKHLIEYLCDALVDFSFGYHKGIIKDINIPEARHLLIEAAMAIYKIDEVQAAKKVYLDDDSEYLDNIKEKNLKRGEFGELILHLILRDFIKTVPLISKIHFKDSDGMTVHGFDAVHIGNSLLDNSKKSLYLGESKLYRDGKNGIKSLIKDVEGHFKGDFLNREFILIGKKRDTFLKIEDCKDSVKEEYEEFLKEKEYWFSELYKLQTGENKMHNLFKSITIPLLCTYTSEVFKSNTDDTTEQFERDYENEINNLKEVFNKELNKLKEDYNNSGEPISTDLNIVLMLFPVPSKKELVKRLHSKLYNQQKA